MPPPPSPEVAEPFGARLADGVELLGEYKGSGLLKPVYLVRRSDGQVVQLSRLLYLAARTSNGARDTADIARTMTNELGRELDEQGAALLLEKLAASGLLTEGEAAGEAAQLPPRARRFAGLTVRGPVLPARAARAAGDFLRPLFVPPVIVVVLIALLAFDSWLAFAHGFLPDVRQLILAPTQLLVLYLVTILAMAVHELGHAAAARYGGAEPGPIGAGIYFLTPVFYTDVTDSYRLDRRGRLRVDLGGLYFNGIFILVLAGLYFATGFAPFLIAAAIQHFQAAFQLLPFIRLDGYYVLSDLVGVPDLFSRMKPTLSTIFRRRQQAGVAELRPSARRVVVVWAVLTNLLLLGGIVFALVRGPEVVGTVRSALAVDLHTLAVAVRERAFGLVAVTVWHLIMLSIPLFAVSVFLARTLVRRRHLLGHLFRRVRPPMEVPMPAEPLPVSDPCLDVGASVERILQTAMGEAETILGKARAEASAIREAAAGERASAAEEAALVRQRAQDECDALVAEAQSEADAIVQRGKEELASLKAARALLCHQLNEIETAARALRATMSGDGRSADGEKHLWIPATVRTLADLTGPDGNGHSPPPVRVLSP